MTTIGKIANVLGLAVKTGKKTKLGIKKPFNYHFVKGSSKFEATDAYGSPTVGERKFAFSFKSRKTPKNKLNLRIKRTLNKRLSSKYTEWGINIDKIKTIPASNKKNIKKYKSKIYNSPNYSERRYNMFKEIMED